MHSLSYLEHCAEKYLIFKISGLLEISNLECLGSLLELSLAWNEVRQSHRSLLMLPIISFHTSRVRIYPFPFVFTKNREDQSYPRDGMFGDSSETRSVA